MNVIRHSAMAALVAAFVATACSGAASAAEETGAPPQPGFAQGGPDGGPGGPGPGFFGPGGHGPEDGPGPHHGFGGHGPGAPGPELPFGGLPPLHGLKLSEAQQDKLFAIMHAQAPERRDHEKAIRKAEEALRELGHADKFDDGKASALSRDLGQAIAADALLRARTEAKVLAVLTPEQRTQLNERREHGPMGPHERGQGPQGEGRPQGQQGQASHPPAPQGQS